MKNRQLVGLIIVVVILLDQLLKIWVKTHFSYNEEMTIFGFDRALLHFVENEGMAFGFSFGGGYGKFLLTTFRLLAVVLLGIYLKELLKDARASRWLLGGFALVQAGAIGNIIDSLFYGLLFSQSHFGGGVAELMPESGGYAPLFYGKVVDMLYFPLFYGNYPDWLPVLGGAHFMFFKPVFNLADVAISGGVIILLIFQFSNRKAGQLA